MPLSPQPLADLIEVALNHSETYAKSEMATDTQAKKQFALELATAFTTFLQSTPFQVAGTTSQGPFTGIGTFS